ncbi:MAG TPA: helix-turn-helix domain-containing protein [Gemmatimonadales bacterium]|jgi:sugar-specific transcriptional regulator TrmB|nr:helix-turn-helix domain-containing protein [Gemmatimonadales bacterium]
MAARALDLTPFGFTPTESRVYAALLRLGPVTGYAAAHAARLARANTYGALEGLVTRAAAVRLPGRPARYRAADPQALIAQLATQQGEALERLSRALADVGQVTEPETRAIEGARPIANLILQLVARAERRVEGVIAADLVRPTLPAWRRAAARAELALHVAGEVPDEARSLVAGSVAPDVPTTLVIDGTYTIALAASGEPLAAIWSSHPVVAALARAALQGVS